MATTIIGGFEQLRASLEITDLQATTTATRQKNVREAVEKELVVLKSFLVGSYARNTMIRPLKEADLDVFLVLSSEYFSKYRPAALLNRVRTVLLRTYPETPNISRNGQAVTITFTDFRVDVVPAFNRSGGGFLIPDSKQDTWIATDPTKHDDALTEANKGHNGKLVPLVKMTKGWNRIISGAFSGFYLELMSVDVLRNISISDNSSTARYIFDKGREKIRFKQLDPAGLGGHVNPLAALGNVEDAVSRFTTAYNRAVKAESFAKEGKISLAFDEWRKIFGDYFPSYG